jgi:hypothetical protein
LKGRALTHAQIRPLLGGRVQYMTSGAAPLTAEVLEMLKICFSNDSIQGVGPNILYFCSVRGGSLQTAKSWEWCQELNNVVRHDRDRWHMLQGVGPFLLAAADATHACG